MRSGWYPFFQRTLFPIGSIEQKSFFEQQTATFLLPIHEDFQRESRQERGRDICPKYEDHEVSNGARSLQTFRVHLYLRGAMDLPAEGPSNDLQFV
jgi:hypothetical protein